MQIESFDVGDEKLYDFRDRIGDNLKRFPGWD